MVERLSSIWIRHRDMVEQGATCLARSMEHQRERNSAVDVRGRAGGHTRAKARALLMEKEATTVVRLPEL